MTEKPAMWTIESPSRFAATYPIYCFVTCELHSAHLILLRKSKQRHAHARTRSE
jgi:hypothetical protein